jgi:hypothetical protein
MFEINQHMKIVSEINFHLPVMLPLSVTITIVAMLWIIHVSDRYHRIRIYKSLLTDKLEHQLKTVT